MSEKPSDIPTPVDFFNWLNQFVNKQTPEAAKAAGTFDPLNAWKTFNEQNQKAWSEAMTKMKATPEFAGALGQATLNQAAAQEMVRKASQAYLEAANMPSLDDLARLAKLVIAVEAKLDSLNEKLAGYLDRTSQDRVVETKLDKLAERLVGLEAKLGEMAETEAGSVKIDDLQTRLKSIETRLDNLDRHQAQVVKAINSAQTQPEKTPQSAKPKEPAKKPSGQSKSQPAKNTGNENKS